MGTGSTSFLRGGGLRLRGTGFVALDLGGGAGIEAPGQVEQLLAVDLGAGHGLDDLDELGEGVEQGHGVLDEALGKLQSAQVVSLLDGVLGQGQCPAHRRDVLGWFEAAGGREPGLVVQPDPGGGVRDADLFRGGAIRKLLSSNGSVDQALEGGVGVVVAVGVAILPLVQALGALFVGDVFRDNDPECCCFELLSITVSVLGRCCHLKKIQVTA